MLSSGIKKKHVMAKKFVSVSGVNLIHGTLLSGFVCIGLFFWTLQLLGTAQALYIANV